MSVYAAPADIGRVPPHNLQAEESLLGAMLLSREAVSVAVEATSADDFYKPAHGHIFEAITNLYSVGEPVDPVTVAEELKRAGLLEMVGGPQTLVTLQAGTPAIGNAGHYATIIDEYALLRRLIQVSNEIAEIGYGLPDDVTKAIDDAESRIFQVAERRVTDSTAEIKDLLSDTLDRLELLYERGESITGTPTGYNDLDQLLAGLQPSSLAQVLGGFGTPIRRVVLTSSHIEYVGGTEQFWAAAFYGRSQTSEHLDQPVDPAVLRRLLPDHAAEYTDEFTTRPVTHTVDEAAWLTPAIHLVPLGGEMVENLVVQAPGAGVVFAGALASFGVTPQVFDGDPAAWADSLDELVGLGDTIVPGHGLPGGEPELRVLQDYLRACVDADGDPAAIPPGPWDDWTDRDNDEINCERAAMLARGEFGPPPSMLRRLGLN